ncbi:hypothetical protein EfmGK961_22960 [Enterococcus faecium]|nr:hypothetical protein EfmGK961_22960 [Enterococcus faecium]
MEQLKAYKFRIYPTEEQEIFFAKSFGCVRKFYNLMLDDRKKAYEEVKNDSSKKMTFPTPAKYKKEFPFLKEIDSLKFCKSVTSFLNRLWCDMSIDIHGSFNRIRQKSPIRVIQRIIKMVQLL